MAFVGLVLLAWSFYRYFGKDKTDIISGCVKVNRSKFPQRWDSENIPAGVTDKAARDLFNSDESLTASIINGFFRGIDVFPSDSAVKYYSKQIKDFYFSNMGLPWWDMVTGELSCKI